MTNPLAISSPHGHDGSSVSRIMLIVVAALVPGMAIYVWTFGVGILIQCVTAIVFALGTEFLVMKLRGRDAIAHLKDGSALVTALLFALSLSPFTPWWITAIGAVFAIAIVKHAFGGLGMNPFNPAMAGYVFVLLSFPAQMNVWPAAPGTIETGPGIADYAAQVFTTGEHDLDAVSGATPLNRMKSQLGLMGMVSEIRTEPLFGRLGGRGWEWIAAGYLAGGVGLLVAGIIGWRIPAAMLTGMFAVSLVFNIYDPDLYAPPLFHLFSGATLLGAFFIATDPVTASTTPMGRLIYGVLIGVLAWSIRVWGAYPDGIAFAVLLANAAVPLIDRFTRPRVLGEGGA